MIDAITDRAAWDEARSDYDRIKREDDAFLPTWKALSAQFKAECEGIPANCADRAERIRAIATRLETDAADDRAERFGDEICDAASRLMEMPAPDLAALRWKLDHLTDQGQKWDCWSDDYTSMVRADIARLLPSE